VDDCKYILCEEAKNICENMRDKAGNDDMAFALNMAAESIGRLPAADVAPVRRGRWEKCWNGRDCMCSECKGYWIPVDEQYDYRYCPKCGALNV